MGGEGRGGKLPRVGGKIPQGGGRGQDKLTLELRHEISTTKME